MMSGAAGRVSFTALTVLVLAGCAHGAPRRTLSCADRATRMFSTNTAYIAARRFVAASRVAESAARISLSCAAQAKSRDQAFADRWRGANALVVSAELAHQAADVKRAHALLREGYAIMHRLRVPPHVDEMTSTLVAEKLEGARRDMKGQWVYW